MAKKKKATRQMSRKSGLTSTAQKMDTSRHGFGTQPAAGKKAGAFGQEPRSVSTSRPRDVSAKGGKGAALRKLKRAR